MHNAWKVHFIDRYFSPALVECHREIGLEDEFGKLLAKLRRF